MSTTNLFLGLASLSAGAYHGFCDAQGIPFEKESIETALTYGPAIVRGTYSSLIGFVKLGATSASKGSDGIESVVMGSVGGAIGAGLGGVVGGAVGGIQTLVGYAAGYLAGYVAR